MLISSYYGPSIGNLIGAGLYMVQGGSVMLIGLTSFNIPSQLRTEIFTGYQCIGMLKLAFKFTPKLLLDEGYTITTTNLYRPAGDLFEIATNAFYLINTDITISIAESLQEIIGTIPEFINSFS